MTASPYFILAILLIIGIALYGIGRILVRSANNSQPQPDAIPRPSLQWTRTLSDSNDPLDIATRIEMIERLGFIAQPWCMDVLAAAAAEERDANVRAAISAALSREST